MVMEIGDSRVELICRDEARQTKLRALGARPGLIARFRWSIDFGNDADLARILMVLRDMGIPLLGGEAGWPPASVADYLRDKSLFSGSYVVAHHLGGGRYIIGTDSPGVR